LELGPGAIGGQASSTLAAGLTSIPDDPCGAVTRPQRRYADYGVRGLMTRQRVSGAVQAG